MKLINVILVLFVLSAAACSDGASAGQEPAPPLSSSGQSNDDADWCAGELDALNAIDAASKETSLNEAQLTDYMARMDEWYRRCQG